MLPILNPSISNFPCIKPGLVLWLFQQPGKPAGNASTESFAGSGTFGNASKRDDAILNFSWPLPALVPVHANWRGIWAAPRNELSLNLWPARTLRMSCGAPSPARRSSAGNTVQVTQGSLSTRIPEVGRSRRGWLRECHQVPLPRSFNQPFPSGYWGPSEQQLCPPEYQPAVICKPEEFVHPTTQMADEIAQ